MGKDTVNQIIANLTQFIFKYDDAPMSSNQHLETAIILIVENLPESILNKERESLQTNSMIQEILDNTESIRTEKLRKRLQG